jgi:hypothetical protein
MFGAFIAVYCQQYWWKSTAMTISFCHVFSNLHVNCSRMPATVFMIQWTFVPKLSSLQLLLRICKIQSNLPEISRAPHASAKVTSHHRDLWGYHLAEHLFHHQPEINTSTLITYSMPCRSFEALDGFFPFSTHVVYTKNYERKKKACGTS